MDTDNETKKPVGAPKQMEGGKRHNVYLDAETVNEAVRLGDGNLSEGLRIAVANDIERAKRYAAATREQHENEVKKAKSRLKGDEPSLMIGKTK